MSGLMQELRDAAALAAEIESRTPTAVLETYLPGRVEVVPGLEFVPLTAGHMLLLEKTGNQLARRTDGLSGADVWQAVWIFTRPAAAGRAALAEGTLQEQVDRLADTVPLQAMEPVVERLSAHLAAAFSMAVEMAAPDGAGGGQKKTVSAG